MKSRICSICGKEYVKVIGVSFAKYCSVECVHEADKKRYKRVQKEYKTCRTCGKDFLATNKNHMYCSDKCTPSHKRNAIRPKTHQYTCEWCGQAFDGGSRRKGNSYRFCSRDCSAKYIAQVKKDKLKPLKYVGTAEGWHTNECVICGRVFLDTAKRLCCCDECQRELNRQRSEQKREAIYRTQRKHCRHCGAEFTPTAKKSKVFCSEECRDEHKKRLQHIWSKKRLHGKIIDKDITLDGLIARDNGRCGLCGGVVDKNDYTIKDGVFIAGAAYPSIDHIKPLSKGGLHSWDNVQLMHHRCNSIKGARVV